MLGDASNSLITDSSRSLQTHTLLSYNTSTVRTIIRESHSLHAELVRASEEFSSQAEPTPGATAELIISALALQRNKRALLVYHRQRIDTLKEAFWEKGGMLALAFGSETDTRKHMAPVDEAFAKGYSDLCLAFKTSWYGDEEDERDPGVQLMDAVDLLGGGTEQEPPRELFVSVRVVEDVGEIETVGGGRMTLSKGSQYFLAREDVEPLVVMGALEIIE